MISFNLCAFWLVPSIEFVRTFCTTALRGLRESAHNQRQIILIVYETSSNNVNEEVIIREMYDEDDDGATRLEVRGRKSNMANSALRC